MPKSSSFPEIIPERAQHKYEAAKARSNPDLDAEKPRDVILNACRAIAENLEADGYSYFKSGPKLKRASGDLTFEVRFQSDRNNIAGRRAAVWIYASVSSGSFARWRAAHPSRWIRRSGPESGRISGGQIGNLGDDPTWMEWDFADRLRREAEVESAVMSIRQLILPYFALFEDEAMAVNVLSQRSTFAISSLLEYALMALGLESAEAAARSFLATHPQVRGDFEKAFRQFSEHGLPDYRGSSGSDLAALAVASGMDLRSSSTNA